MTGVFDMAGSLNKVTLIGNLGADPEVRTMEMVRKSQPLALQQQKIGQINQQMNVRKVQNGIA